MSCTQISTILLLGLQTRYKMRMWRVPPEQVCFSSSHRQTHSSNPFPLRHRSRDKSRLKMNEWKRRMEAKQTIVTQQRNRWETVEGNSSSHSLTVMTGTALCMPIQRAPILHSNWPNEPFLAIWRPLVIPITLSAYPFVCFSYYLAISVRLCLCFCQFLPCNPRHHPNHYQEVPLRPSPPTPPQYSPCPPPLPPLVASSSLLGVGAAPERAPPPSSSPHYRHRCTHNRRSSWHESDQRDMHPNNRQFLRRTHHHEWICPRRYHRG